MAGRVPNDTGGRDESSARGESAMQEDAGQPRENFDAGKISSENATGDAGGVSGLTQEERSGQFAGDKGHGVLEENTRKTQGEFGGPVTTAIAVDWVAASVGRSKTEYKTRGKHVREAQDQEEEAGADGGRGGRSSVRHRQSELFDSLDLSTS